MTMGSGDWERKLGPDAAARPTTPTPIPRAATDNRTQAVGRAPDADNDDPPGLPLSIVLLDVPQPYDEASDSAGDDPPALVRDAPYDALRALPSRTIPGTTRVVYGGGPRALTAGFEAQWAAWWADRHKLTVSTAGWCIYRDWDVKHPTRTVPLTVVMELPCLTMDGSRARVRAAVNPAYWRMSSELTVAKRSARLVPLNLTIEHEAEAGADGFADRWAAWKSRRR